MNQAELDSLVRAEEMHATLLAELHPQHLEVLDESAAHAGHAGANEALRGTHFRVRMAGVAAFKGKSRVQTHRMVYACLQPYLQRSVHALALEIT